MDDVTRAQRQIDARNSVPPTGGWSAEYERREAEIRDEAFERGVAVGRAEAEGTHTLDALTGNRFWCCVCLSIDEVDRPEDWADDPLTVIGGDMLCDEHVPYGDRNGPLYKYRQYWRTKRADT